MLLDIPSYYDPFANVTVRMAIGVFVLSSAYNGGSEILTYKWLYYPLFIRYRGFSQILEKTALESGKTGRAQKKFESISHLL